jgi:hypothetical protein
MNNLLYKATKVYKNGGREGAELQRTGDLFRLFAREPELVAVHIKEDVYTRDAYALRVPRKYWGRDHISTFLYIEARVVDHKGRLSHSHMRVNGDAYPSRLTGVEPLEGHNDYNCADDLEREGLLINNGTGVNRVYELTQKGWAAASFIRKARATNLAIKDYLPDLCDTIDETENDEVEQV